MQAALWKRSALSALRPSTPCCSRAWLKWTSLVQQRRLADIWLAPYRQRATQRCTRKSGNRIFWSLRLFKIAAAETPWFACCWISSPFW